MRDSLGWPVCRDDSRWWNAVARFKGLDLASEPRYATVERTEGGALVYVCNFMKGRVSLDRLARQKALVTKSPLPIIGDCSGVSDEKLVEVAISDKAKEVRVAFT